MQLGHKRGVAAAILVSAIVLTIPMTSRSGAVATTAGRVFLVKKTSPEFDRYTNTADVAMQRWMRDRFWRMLVYSPYFDEKTSPGSTLTATRFIRVPQTGATWQICTLSGSCTTPATPSCTFPGDAIQGSMRALNTPLTSPTRISGSGGSIRPGRLWPEADIRGSGSTM